MGRYAYFSNGFTYKFWFGIQASQDILEFYGDVCDDESSDYESNDDESYEYDKPGKISWDSSVHKYIKESLDEMKEENPQFLDIPWASFENSIEGTEKLYEYFCENDKSQSKEAAKYMLGSLIYHQLQYEDNLTCKFDY
jgi:hypothetical protein